MFSVLRNRPQFVAGRKCTHRARAANLRSTINTHHPCLGPDAKASNGENCLRRTASRGLPSERNSASCRREAASPPAAVKPLRHEHYVPAWFGSVGTVLSRSPQRFDWRRLAREGADAASEAVRVH